MKTIEERLDEMVTLRRKIKQLGIGTEQFPEVQEVFDRMNEFALQGTSWTGGVYLKDVDRNMIVKLSKYRPSDIILRVPSTSKRVSRLL